MARREVGRGHDVRLHRSGGRGSHPVGRDRPCRPSDDERRHRLGVVRARHDGPPSAEWVHRLWKRCVMTSISGARVLVTGVTSEVAKPVAIALAKENEVFGAARWKDPASREPFESNGVKPVFLDLVKGDLSGLPEQVDYVAHFAV